MTHDAIVVGARVAGSPTAMLLARRGYRVLLLDRARFPSDTMSTHYMHPRGHSLLNRWGLLERVLALAPSWERITVTREGLSLTGTQPYGALRERLAQVSGGDGAYAVMRWSAPRRGLLDSTLAEAAVEAGAELRTGCVVEELIWDGERVAGVRGRTTSGKRFEERARFVIGADGRHSTIARLVGARSYNEREHRTYAYYSYWSGVDLDGVPWPTHFRGRLGLSVYPTDSGLTHLVIFGPDEWFRRFRADVERSFDRHLSCVSPALAELLASGHREDRIRGTVDQPHYFHVPFGPGWALVGDAGYNKDQCTAIGMTHALRDAELLAVAVHEAIGDGRDEAAALEEYAARRDADALEYYTFVANMAEMRPPRLEPLRVWAALPGNQAQIDRCLGVSGDVVPSSDFYAPANVEAIMRERTVSEPALPILADHERSAAAYMECPF
jgi:2-polyprenyl-6-methoxyphenol hydroxylase-like FAD-dependent oxidoreductase